MAILEKVNEPGHFLVECPGCEMLHAIFTKEYQGKGPKWDWNGSFTAPTFSPSLLVRHSYDGPTPKVICHSYIRDGKWQFLGDCTHRLAGKTVDMIEVD